MDASKEAWARERNNTGEEEGEDNEEEEEASRRAAASRANETCCELIVFVVRRSCEGEGDSLNLALAFESRLVTAGCAALFFLSQCLQEVEETATGPLEKSEGEPPREKEG